MSVHCFPVTYPRDCKNASSSVQTQYLFQCYSAMQQSGGNLAAMEDAILGYASYCQQIMKLTWWPAQSLCTDAPQASTIKANKETGWGAQYRQWTINFLPYKLLTELLYIRSEVTILYTPNCALAWLCGNSPIYSHSNNKTSGNMSGLIK